MISLDRDAGSSTYKAVIQHPHKPWESRTAPTANGALEIGRAIARAELVTHPEARRIVVSIIALCPRCSGQGTYAVRAGFLHGGGQAKCGRCDGSGVAESVAKEWIHVWNLSAA